VNLGITQDSEIVFKDTADIAAVLAYNESGEDEDGPNPSAIKMDLIGAIDTLWNKRVLDILQQKFRELEAEENWNLPYRSNFYIYTLIHAKMGRLHTAWRKAQSRIKEDGTIETDEEWESRITAQQEADWKKARHQTRRLNVSGENEMRHHGANKTTEV
jgi:hypothetical protein